MLVIDPAVAVKVVEVVPDGTVTELDTGNRVLLLDSNTSTPPAGAAALSVMVQVVVIVKVKLLGSQTSCDTGSA